MKRLTLSADIEKAKSDKGRERVIDILSHSRDLIIVEGYHSLSMRKIAKRSGITVGNLSYYYASKQELLHDLVKCVLLGYQLEWQEILDDENRTPEQKLGDYIRLLIEDLGTESTTRFFPELWIMASHDETVAQIMDDVYRQVRVVIRLLVSSVNPGLNDDMVRSLALFINASIEGHTIFIGHGKSNAHQVDDIMMLVDHVFVQMVKNADNNWRLKA